MTERTTTERFGSLTLTTDYRPGALAEVVALHVRYYAPAWGLGRPFESTVAEQMGAFMARLDPARDLFLCAYDAAGALQASITIDGLHGADQGGRLRWFIASEACRGTGLGRHMLERALAFCRARGYPGLFLTTFAGLDAARHLYESVGFELVRELEEDQWGGGVREQHFALKFDDRPAAGAA